MYAYSQQIAKPSNLEVFWSKLIKGPKQIVKIGKDYLCLRDTDLS
jgi:hypothetical protein